MKPPMTDLWAVTATAAAETPYAYVTGDNWEQAMTNATRHPEVLYRSQLDNGFAIRRLTLQEACLQLNAVTDGSD